MGPVALKWTRSAQLKRKQHKNNEKQKEKKGSSGLWVKIINILIATNLFKYERVGTPANMSTFLHLWLQFTPSNRFQWMPNMTLLWGFSLSVPTQTQPSADQMDIYSIHECSRFFFFCYCCLCSALIIFSTAQPVRSVCRESPAGILIRLKKHISSECSGAEESDWITASYLFMTMYRM